MKTKECPCYTCIVQAACIGAEPSLKEKERWDTPEYQKELNDIHFKDDDQMDKEIQDLENKWDINLSWSPRGDFSLPSEYEAQLNCELYCKWAGIEIGLEEHI